MRTSRKWLFSRIAGIAASALILSACDKDPSFTVTEETLVDEVDENDADAIGKKKRNRGEGDATGVLGTEETFGSGNTTDGSGDATDGSGDGDGSPDAFATETSAEEQALRDLLDRLIEAGIGSGSGNTSGTSSADGSGSSDGSNSADGSGANTSDNALVVIYGDETSDEARIIENLGDDYVEQITDSSMDSEYTADALKEGSTEFGLEEYEPSQTISMTNTTIPASKSFTQIERPMVIDTHTQGVTGSSATDTFNQNDSTQLLDILVVVDSSGSMAQEQEGLATRLNPLLSFVQDSDWKIAVTTTDPEDTCVRDIITKADTDPSAKFAAAVTVGIDGTGNEQGIRMAVEGLKAECLNSGWLRANSTVAVLMVSDEDNCSSNGVHCEGEAWASESYLTDYLGTIRNVGQNARVYGLIWHPDQTSNECSTAYYQAEQYASAISATGGTWGSICPNGSGVYDYTAPLQAISQNISTILDNQFILTQTPDNGTATVKVNGTTMNSGWTIIGNTLSFDQAPGFGSTIEVSYVYGSTPVNTSFALSQPAVAGTIEASINSSDTTNFSFDAGTNTVTFNSAPAPMSQILFKFRKQMELPKTFAVGEGAMEGSVTATINGATTSAFTYDSASGNVTFSQAPADAAEIKIDYALAGDPMLTYAYTRVAEASNLSVTDASSGEDVAFSMDTNSITFEGNEFDEGRQILITEKDTDMYQAESQAIVLSQKPIPSSVIVRQGADNCSGENLQISENMVDWTDCNFAPMTDSTNGSVMFTYYETEALKFAIPAEFFNTPHVLQVWTVYVDGELRTDYKVEANAIQFNTPLANGAKININVKLIKGL